MVARTCFTLTPVTGRFSYADACEISERITAHDQPVIVFIDFQNIAETSTDAWARLVLLRRDLLRSGRDLRIVGLRGRAEALYELNGMARLLPRQAQLAAH